MVIGGRRLCELSGGELQRVAIGLTLVQRADVYLFDEPSSFLDVAQRCAAPTPLGRHAPTTLGRHAGTPLGSMPEARSGSMPEARSGSMPGPIVAPCPY